MNTNENNQNDRKMSRDELSSAYEDLLRNFTEDTSSSGVRPVKNTTAARRKPEPVKKTAPRAKTTESKEELIFDFSETLSEKEPAKMKTESKKQTAKPAKTSKQTVARTATVNSDMTDKQRKKDEKRRRKQQYKATKRKFRKQRWAHTALSLLVSAMLIVVIVLTSSALKIPLLGVINDIIAIDRSDIPVAVYITEDMDVEQILVTLEEHELIYSAEFCNLLMGFFGYDDDSEFVVGEHTLNAKMGVEGMLNSMLFETDTYATVKITFPEGYTIDQIAEKLYSEKVISAKNVLYNAIATYEFPAEFDFLNSVTDPHKRYRLLEGYMYPDTYEFYLGENVNSVINRFLNNFSAKWIDEYSDEAEALGYTVDEIITMASILQKEANDANQMYTISSILHNRLASDSLRILQCDSTQDYIAKIDAGLLNQTELNALLEIYDTYQCSGLPIGPICNPGSDAIYAALHPDDTNLYYFCHDADGNMYTARTLEEHSINVQNYVK